MTSILRILVGVTPREVSVHATDSGGEESLGECQRNSERGAKPTMWKVACKTIPKIDFDSNNI